jgi:zinc and cadmium transporter
MTAFSLTGEAFELIENRWAIASVLGGFLFMWGLHSILPETHHHHDEDCAHATSKRPSIKILIGDSIHNIADGIVIVAAFTASTELGIFAAISIFIHEFIQEISEFFVLRSSGFSIEKSLLLNLLTSLTIFVGVGLGFILVETIALQGVLLGFTAGIFLHIVSHDLFPYKKLQTKKQRLGYVGMFVLGALLLAAVGLATPHTHSHEEHEYHDEHTEEHVDEHYEDEDHLDDHDHDHEEYLDDHNHGH